MPRRYLKRNSYRHRTSYRPRGALSSARYKRSYRSVLNNDAVKQLKVIQYPHSTLTTNPKIPDGGETTSIGMRRHMFGAVTMATAAKFFECYLIPHLMDPFVVYEVDADGITQRGPGAHYFSTGILVNTPLGASGGAILENNQTEVGRWRCVSLGLRIRNTNNDTGDQGSWSAARIQLNKDASAYVASSTLTGQITNIIPEFGTWNQYPAMNKMPDLPSFNSGLVKDIDKHYFRCVDVSTNDHEFQLMTDMYLEKAGGTWTWGTAAQIGNGTYANAFTNAIIDHNMDGLKIVISGTQNVTSFVFDVVMNIEYVPYSTSNSTRFCDECAFAPDSFRKVRNMLRMKYSKA